MAFRRSIFSKICLVFAVLLLIAPIRAAQAFLLPNDTYYGRLLYLTQIHAQEAWERTMGSRNIVVAVLDTGVAIDHPDLRQNIWTNPREIEGDGIDNDQNGYIDDVHGWDFVTNTNDPRPRYDDIGNPGGVHHGTIVAGVIGAIGNNEQGIVGVNWQVHLMPLRLLTSSGMGATDKVDDAIRYAVDNGASVINLSFTSEVLPSSIAESIRYAYTHGVVVVTAAGNDLFNGGLNLNKVPLYPICMPPMNGKDIVLGVASVTQNDVRAEFSNYGSACVDLAAPGEGIFGTQAANGLYKGFEEYYGGGWSGTSVSAPMVSGAAALLKAKYPGITAEEVIRILKESADPIDAKNPGFAGMLGSGRLNLRAALDLAASQPIKRSTSIELLVAGKGPGAVSRVNILDTNGNLVTGFQPYASKFLGGVRVATGDLDGDGQDEIVIAPGPGGGPHIKVYELDGKLIGEFFAYSATFTGGVQLAVADVDGDDKAEIVTAPGSGMQPLIRIFRMNGQSLGGFEAFDASFKGGVSVAAVDVNGDRHPEIVAGMLSGGRQLRTFAPNGSLMGLYSVPSLSDQGFVLAGADVDADGLGEMILGERQGTGMVLIMNALGLPVSLFPVANESYRGGVLLGAGDLRGDAASELLIGLRGQPSVLLTTFAGKQLQSIQAFSTAPGGVVAAVARMNVEQ